jgi:hypothetical protein
MSVRPPAVKPALQPANQMGRVKAWLGSRLWQSAHVSPARYLPEKSSGGAAARPREPENNPKRFGERGGHGNRAGTPASTDVKKNGSKKLQ